MTLAAHAWQVAVKFHKAPRLCRSCQSVVRLLLRSRTKRSTACTCGLFENWRREGHNSFCYTAHYRITFARQISHVC